MRLIKFIFRQSPFLMVSAIGIGAMAGAASTGLITVIHQAIDSWEARPDWLAPAFVALCGARLLASLGAQYLLLRLAQEIALDLRTRLSRQILASPLRHLEEVGAPRLLAVLTNDVSTVVQTLINIPLAIIDFTVLVGGLAYLGWLSWPALAAFLLFTGLGLVVYRIALARGYHFYHLHRGQLDSLYDHFRAVIEGVKELKLHLGRRRQFLLETFDPTVRSMRRLSVTAETIFSFAASWEHILVLLFIGLLIFVLPGLSIFDPTLLSGIALVALFLAGPLEGVVIAVPELSRAAVSLAAIDSLGLGFDRQSVDTGAPAGLPSWSRMELSGVTHRYYHEGEERSFTLGPIECEISRGELVFVTGGNGSGKTTFAKLLTGLYLPESGELRLDGESIHDGNRESYRQLFATVFWDYYLFKELTGLNPSLVERDAPLYLEKLQLEKKVEVLKGALSTTHLSQGQKKRLALLTAYLEDRPIYLFDEWAADQDPSFKEVFYRSLLPELKGRGKTVFVISHDDRYYDVADRVLTLEDGQLRSDVHLPGAENPGPGVAASDEVKVQS